MQVIGKHDARLCFYRLSFDAITITPSLGVKYLCNISEFGSRAYAHMDREVNHYHCGGGAQV